MVRYFPHVNPAVHPCYPHLAAFAPANVNLAVFGSCGSLGILLGLARYSGNVICNRRSGGLCMRSTAICAVASVPFCALYLMTRSGSVECKKRAYLTNLRKIDVDDWYLAGALLGTAIAAVPVRCPAVTGWKRYLGAASMGSLGGRDVYVMKHRKEFVRAEKLQKEYINERRKYPEGR